MKKLVISLLILIFVSILVLNTNKKKVDYTIATGNELSSMKFDNDYISRVSNKILQYDMQIPEQFELVADTSVLNLYLEEETMAIAILNKDNDYVWYSYDVFRDFSEDSDEMVQQIKSGIHLRTYTDHSPLTRTLLDKDLLNNNIATIDYDKQKTGFTAHIDFAKIQIRFDVKVYIENNDLVIEIPRDTIEEYDPDLLKPGNKNILINDILIYPFLGATKQEENGYIVIPDGSGAIVSLEETPKSNKSYVRPVYGEDIGYKTEPVISNLKVLTIKPYARVTLPIYGIIHDVGNTGLLVISESGSNYAMYNYISKDTLSDYYQTYFHYNYRTSYTQFQSRVDRFRQPTHYQKELNRFELKQRYVFLSGDDADYVGVAKNYRSFLERTNQLKSIINNNQYSTKIDLIGNEIEPGIIWDKNVPTTTYQEAIDLVKKLKEDGYSNLDISYKTFDKKNKAYLFDTYGHLGGKDDFIEMLQYFNDNDVDFSYYIDYVKSYEMSKYSASRMNSEVLSNIQYSYMYLYYYINQTKYLPQFIQNDYDVFSQYGISSLALDGFDSVLYTQMQKHSDVKYSTENMNDVQQALNILQDNDMSINLYNPDAYLYKYTDKYYDAPITSSELLFIDATIPLVELVVSGYMPLYSPYLNFISSEQNTLLRLIEYGVNPSYIMTSKNTYELKYSNSSDIYISQYESLNERMKRYDTFIRPALNEISGVEMVNHYFYGDGVVVTEYANGKKVVINYNSEQIQFEGKIIAAKGYEVL